MTRIAVFGASGFVGATVVERLLARGHSVRPLIHSTASAWRLGRYGIDLRPVELLNAGEVRTALEGCTHVVNCSRGPRAVMFQGLRNLLEASRELGIRRFVHLSSVAVYGDQPPPESSHEDAPTKPVPDSYGWTKLEQDGMVQAACRRGLPSVILCPPYIAGAYSNFVLRVLDGIQAGSFALVDAGTLPSNLIDVQNLAQAAELALFCEEADGARIFVTNDEDTRWRDVAEALLPLVGRPVSLDTVRAEDARRLVGSAATPKPSTIRTFKRLISSREVLNILREDPLLQRSYLLAQRLGGIVSPALVRRLKAQVSPPPRIARQSPSPRYDKHLVSLQLRGVRHTCDRARAVLNYTPELSFAASMQAFATWYRRTHGWGEDYAPLFGELNRGVAAKAEVEAV